MSKKKFDNAEFGFYNISKIVLMFFFINKTIFLGGKYEKLYEGGGEHNR